MYFTATIFLLALNTLWMICQAVPLLDPKSTPGQDVLETIVTSACSSSGGCWELLPMEEVYKDDLSTIPDDLSIPKVHVRRQTSNEDLNMVVETWADNAPSLSKEIHQSSLATKQIGNRLSKKDAAMARSWSAGGMPFSVLYMNSHNPRGNHASTPQQGFRKIESSTPPTIHPNTRITLRNRGSTPSRRQYSIIPQLFVSYGWGPFGK